MRSIISFIVLVVAGAIVLGLVLGGTELLNPNKAAAEAEKTRAETDVFVAQNNHEQQRHEIELKALEEQTAYERQRHEIELKTLEEQAAYEQQRREIELRALEEQAKQQTAVEAQALAARRAKELELFELAVIVGLGVLSAVVIVLSGVGGYYLIRPARRPLLEQQPAQATTPPAREGRLILYPQRLVQEEILDHVRDLLADEVA
jgi:hypothetical protein